LEREVEQIMLERDVEAIPLARLSHGMQPFSQALGIAVLAP
jgi:hypothetical protein